MMENTVKLQRHPGMYLMLELQAKTIESLLCDAARNGNTSDGGVTENTTH